MQRREENRVAAFSQWTIAMYAWNKEEMQKGVAYPSKAFWNQLLVLPLRISNLIPSDLLHPLLIRLFIALLTPPTLFSWERCLILPCQKIPIRVHCLKGV